MYAPPDLRPRALVAIASFGTANDRYLQRLIHEYRAMPFDIDFVVLSNLDKSVGAGVEVIVGLPTRNPWSLRSRTRGYLSIALHLFRRRHPDDGTVRHFLEVTSVLNDDEIAGFLRFEEGRDGSLSYPDVHGHFHWAPASLRTRGKYTLAHFTNEHSACCVLTQDQLKRAIDSGGFLMPPHEWKYDLLCTAATDTYAQCGFTKLLCHTSTSSPYTTCRTNMRADSV